MQNMQQLHKLKTFVVILIYVSIENLNFQLMKVIDFKK